MNSKIKNEIKELLENNVVSTEVAAAITDYYKSKEVHSPNRLLTIFGVLGSALVGLGIILILAHNWDDFSKTLKTTFAFLPLVLGQIIVAYAILKSKNQVWREASGVFLFFAVGASMALVSQIYNIPGDLNSFLFTWTVLCLPLIYILKSNALMLLHVVLTTYYACTHGYFYDSEVGTPWLYILLLSSVMPYYGRLLKYQKESNLTSVLNWLIPLSITIVLGSFVDKSEELGYLMYILFFGLIYNIGNWPYFKNQRLRRNGYLILGSLGTVFILLLTSFEWFWEDLIRHDVSFNSQEGYLSLALLLTAAGVLFYSYLKKWIIKFNLFQYVFGLFLMIFFIGSTNNVLPIVLINILILALGIMAVKLGADSLHLGILNYGLIIVSVLIVCRFFDTNMSYVLRGLLFVIVGLGFFVSNYLMLKRQKSIEK